MDTPGRWDVLASCPVADEAVWLCHATAFVASFVIPTKRERWLELFTRRPRRIGRDSHKLHAALDRRTCRLVPELPPVCLRGEGAFYGFYDTPRVVPATLAERAAGGGDAVFLLVPGELAVYFFHKGEIWLCQSG